MKALTHRTRAVRGSDTKVVPPRALARARQAADKLVSKRDFILSMPEAKANEVVAAAKRQRITLTQAYVYMVRSRENKVPRRAAKTERALPKPRIVGRQAEQTLIDTALDIGLVRAQELLAAVRTQMSAA
jgi:protein-tyrosine-phosphatase